MPSTAESLQTSATIPLEQIRESPRNHRKYFDEAQLQELAESVKAHGVLQPVLVRPAPPPVGGKVKYELVYGHRRFRAARLAKLKEIPATVRAMDDKAALEVALIENCRRADVLPMEEAEGYRELHEKHGVSVEQLAERVGKSKEYVYGRLKLCALKAPAVRQALDAGGVSPSLALLIARIPGEKLQEQAAKKILEGGGSDEDEKGKFKPGPMSYRRALEVVQDEYMLQLSKAPFNTKDAKLVPEAGACGPCPKRTGNCKELYPDVKSEIVCTDPECFGKKKAAAFKLEQEAARAKGQKLLKDSKALWDWEGKKLGYKGQEKYVELTDTVPGDKKKRTFKELLGDKAPVVLARDPNGKVHHLLVKTGLQEALEAAGHKLKLKEPKVSGEREDWAAREAEGKFRERVAERLVSKVVEALLQRKSRQVDAVKLMASCLYDVYDVRVVQAWCARTGVATAAELGEALSSFDTEQSLAFVVDAVVGEALSNVWNGYPSEMAEACALAGVRLEELEEEQRKEDAAATAAPPAKAAKDRGPGNGPDEGVEEAE